MPTYAKASSLYRTLTDILHVERQAASSQPHHGDEPGGEVLGKKASKKSKHAHLPATPEPLHTPDGPQSALAFNNLVCHTDVLLQFELRQLLKQEMLELHGLKKSDVNNLQLTYVTVTSSTLLDSNFLDKFVRNRQHQPRLLDPSKSLQDHSFIQFIQQSQQAKGIHDKTRIENCAALFVVRKKLFLVKENWHKWSYKRSVDVGEFRAYKRAIVKAHEKKKAVPAGSKREIEEEAMIEEEEDGDPTRQEARAFNARNLVGLFDLILCVRCEEID